MPYRSAAQRTELEVLAANGVETYKIYSESFRGQAHRDAIVEEARQIVHVALANP